MQQINYHHLRYFYAIVREGTLTAAAARMNVSQSSLSVQLKQLEENLQCALFNRMHKSLQLTEEGRMVFDYAETIFRTGDEMLATLQNRSGKYKEVLRVGAVATLSRNFQLSFLRPVIDNESVEVVITSASMSELLGQLNAHTIDLVLSNRAVKRDGGNAWQSRLVAEQVISLIGGKQYRKRRRFRFPEDLKDVPMVLPTTESEIRNHFDILMTQHGVRPLIAAEADDMAMLRLLSREIDGISLLPPVVVQDELEQGLLFDLHQLPTLSEHFYAITIERKYPNPLLQLLLND
ncbi:LysR family transcriptional regulator [Cerasicoccus fimbriatus]|uniref:LysR family transcriptional regulator n=1 Tax=Cerasicoccus fimbriatus TaxID=3014554 RepID=UPI0022B2EE28|nr:LysR family transcriptional regulator [Cerasicoccus sp. TK19100]